MEYRELQSDEVDKIKMIDATWFIKNVWRNIEGQLQLVEINWTEYELPNGLEWHMDRFRKTIESGGKAFGCFDGDTLVGYATVNSEIFGSAIKYVLLDQLFVSKDYRNHGIGKKLFSMCKKQSQDFGADKLYLCSASAEDTVAFYRKLGCQNATEVNQALYEQDPNDIQMEF